MSDEKMTKIVNEFIQCVHESGFDGLFIGMFSKDDVEIPYFVFAGMNDHRGAIIIKNCLKQIGVDPSVLNKHFQFHEAPRKAHGVIVGGGRA